VYTTAAAEPFWNFSIQVYSTPLVADLSLSLQDKYGFDVNVLLLCLWLAQERCLTLDQETMHELRRGVAELNENLVWPIRRARRWVKASTDKAFQSLENAERRKFYESLQLTELKGERFVQSALIECLSTVGEIMSKTPEAAARISLENYREAIAAPEISKTDLEMLVVRVLS